MWPTKSLRALAILTLALVGLGSFVRATGAGLSCPDWPLCFGRVVPEFTYGVTQEVVHRYLAGFVMLLTLSVLYRGYRSRSESKGLLKFGTYLFILVCIQAIFGGLTVTMKLNPFVVTMHLALGTIFFQSVALGAFPSNKSPVEIDSKLRGLLLFLSVLTFFQILLGGFVGASGASLSCLSFPQCGTENELIGPQVVQMLHRITGFSIAAGLFLALYWSSKLEGNERRVIFGGVLRTAFLVLVQIGIGWLNVVLRIPAWVTVLHILMAQGILIHLLMLWRKSTVWNSKRLSFFAKDMLSLCKPGIMLLLLISTGCPMIVAAGGHFPVEVFIPAIIGGALLSGSASALNCIWDRDIDAIMERTKKRPLAAGRVSVKQALVLSIVLGILGVVVLWRWTNPAAALVALSGHLFYFLVYTVTLKRTTPQNIVIGGAAGAVPPIVGWVAVTGQIELPAFMLFLIIFLWTPPHFWALALNRNEDYRRASIPMLPVVAGERVTHIQMLVYALLLIPTSLILVMVTPQLGAISAVGLTLLAGIFSWKNLKLFLLGKKEAGLSPAKVQTAWDIFKFSLIYLALVFATTVVDSSISGPVFAAKERAVSASH